MQRKDRFDEEDGRLFQTATNSITTMIHIKQKGEEITDEVTEKIVQILQMQEMNFSFLQQQTAGAAIVVSARIVLSQTTTPEKLSMICVWNQGLEMISSFDKLPSFLWSNAQPLFHFYLESIPKDTPGATRILNFLIKIFDILKLSPKVNDDFFNYRSVLSPARVIINTLEILKNVDRDLALRKLSLEVLSRIVRQCPQKKAPTISLLVSGLLTGLMKITKGNFVNAELLEYAICLIGDTIVLVFGDKSPKFDIRNIDLECYHRELHCVFLNQNEEWRTNGTTIICDYLKYLLSHYMIYRVHDVRRAVCQLLIQVQTNCEEMFGDRLYNNILHMYTYLRYDDYPFFQELAESCLPLVKNQAFAEQYLYDQLESHTTRLPIKTRSGDGELEIKVICALLNGIGEGVSLLCTTGSPTIELLLRSLADSIVIDKKRLAISHDIPSETIEYTLQKFKLQHDLTHRTLQRICALLAELGGFEVFDMVHNLMRVESPQKRASYHVILAYLLSSLDLEKTSSDEPVILMIAEYLVAEANKSCLIRLKDDFTPKSDRTEIDWGECIESLSLVNVAICMKFIGETANRSTISINCLCTILYQTQNISFIVSESARFALKYLIQNDKNVEDENELIRFYSSHILNRVSQACASSIAYHMAPVLLKAYLGYAGTKEHFDVFRVIIIKMLFALDNNQQRYSYEILQTMLAFMDMLNSDYPNHQPLPPLKDSEDEKCLPTPQHIIVEKILHRTKHMLTSESIPVRITVLEMLSNGLELLKCYDDMLLPMIHQNWYGIMAIVREKEPLTLEAITEVVSEMAEHSGSFVHNKILNEFWPAVKDYLMNIVRRNDHFQHTAKYALATKFLSRIPKIVIGAQFTEQEYNETFLKLFDISTQVEGAFEMFSHRQKEEIDQHFKNLREEGKGKE